MSRAQIFALSLGSRLTLRAGSCLIVDGGTCILVDPGALGGPKQTEQALQAACGLGLRDVTTVFYTHLHFDHYGPEDLGTEAGDIAVPQGEYDFIRQLMARRHDLDAYRRFLLGSHDYIAPVFLRQFLRLAHDPRYDFSRPELRARLRLVAAGERLSPAVRTVALEGHCPGQLGLGGSTQWGDTVVAGDAVLSLKDFRGQERLLIVCNREKLAESKQRVATADCVVPSHGAWFHPKKGIAIEAERTGHE